MVFTFLLEVFTLAFRTVTSDGADSGAFSDLDPATVAGLAAVGLTGGGAFFVGATVLPAQVATGLLVGGAGVALGEVNRRTGSYFPFLAKQEDAVTGEADATATA